MAYRSRQLSFRRTQVSQWLSHEHSQLREEIELQKGQGEVIDDEYISSRISDIEKEAKRQEKDALAMYGMLEGADPRIAPLRRALAVWGLTADDVGVLSIHGTSTNANMERRLHVYRSYAWKCRPDHGAKESPWTCQRRIRVVANDGSASIGDHRHCSWQSQQRVSWRRLTFNLFY